MKRWNIWRIQNRWVRAIVVVLVGTPILVASSALVALVAIVVGLGEGAAYALSVFRHEQDLKIISQNYWRAVTLREAA